MDELKFQFCTEKAAMLNQDRLAILRLDHGMLLVLSDGAGGSAGGEKAAEIVIECGKSIDKDALHNTDTFFWIDLISHIDREVFLNPQAGEATTIIIYTDGRKLSGASVGDSQAWLIDGDVINDLTFKQMRRPMIGSGVAHPISFGPIEFNGILLMATDGLFHYTKTEMIKKTVKSHPMDECGPALIDSVRLRSGTLQDDVSIILCKGLEKKERS